jgi:Zn-dependent protease with chaperone function
MPSKTTDHATRAVALYVAFWGGLAVGIGGLLAAPLVEWLVFGRGSLFGAALVGLALWLLWALVPNTDDWVPPGAELTPETQPALFAQIQEVTDELGLAPPEQVFVVPRGNAAIGSHKATGERVRFLSLGFPLLAGLTPAELRAVIAHEFGHEHQGDLRLGPWVYSTRAAAFQALERLEGSSFGPQRLIQAYARWFLGASMEISRQQELHADATGSRLAGSAAMESALRRLEQLVPAWHAFWMGEVLPTLDRGLLPPIAQGFRDLAAVDLPPNWAPDPDPFDTHPATSVRAAALADLRDRQVCAPDPFVDLDHAERAVLDYLLNNPGAARPVTWDEATDQVFVQSWRDELRAFGSALRPMTPLGLVDAVQNLGPWVEALRPMDRRSGARWPARRTRCACSASGWRWS